MEWVETTARSVEEAKDLALDQLGVSEDDAEFEVLEEPRPGLFGRVRGQARVRARVRPTTPRAKAERTGRRRKPAGDEAGTPSEESVPATAAEPARPPARKPRAPRAPAVAAAAEVADVADGGDGGEQETGSETGDATARPSRAPRGGQARRSGRNGRPAADRVKQGSVATDPSAPTGENDVPAEQVGEEAVRFLDGLVSAFGLEGTTALSRDGDELEVRVEGDDLGMLIGPRGSTILAIQDLTRVVSQRRLGDHETRLRIDIGGYRERRRVALSRFTAEQAEAVKASGQARVLEPMPSADRKVIHDTVANIDGVSSRSEGDDPFRRVVIVPAAAAD